MKVLSLIPVLLAAPVIASYSTGLVRREDTCNIQLASSSGGRKIAIVIDSSGSMRSNDPLDLRIEAGKGLNRQLIPGSDQVSVIDFDGGASILYPLGDPSGAESSFDQIDSSGGTDIASGVETAIDVLTAVGSGSSADRSGIVVLTDGSSSISSIITQVERATALGIRVSFGFLASSTTNFKPDLLTAILNTGGSYTTFDSADAIQSFLFLVLSNGIVANDVSSSSEQPLLPGITVAKLSGSGAVTFAYEARTGEILQFAVSSLSGQELNAELQDVATGSTIGTNSTVASSFARAGPPATIDYVGNAAVLKLVVAAVNDTAEGVFQVRLNSSLGIAGCNLNDTKPPVTNTTTGNNTVDPTGSPYPTQTVSAAGHIAEVGLALVGVFAAMILL